MTELAAGGRRCLAPDLYGLGESTGSDATTFEDEPRGPDAPSWTEIPEGRVALVVHDWGGFVGLAWACDHPKRVAALVIANTGFFSDGRWHGMAEAIRGDDGEAIVAAIDRDGFGGAAQLLRRRLRRGGRRGLLGPVRRGPRAARDARLLPLDGLREARALAGQARRNRRADAPALGRRRPVRSDRGRRAPPRRDPRLAARLDRGRRPLRLRRGRPSAASRRSPPSSASSATRRPPERRTTQADSSGGNLSPCSATISAVASMSNSIP